jgi:hypothetical protein
MRRTRMIHCPHCGTANQDGTKFCVECGQLLAASNIDGMPCPQCGARNAPGTVFCDECGTRLVPASSISPEQESEQTAPIKGFSLPKKQTGELGPTPLADDSADVPEKVPPWLQKLLGVHGFAVPEKAEEEFIFEEREVEAEPGLEEEEERPALVEPEWEAEAPATDWLQDLRAQGEDWEEEVAEVPELLPSSDEEDVDWLRSLREVDAEGAVESFDVAGVDEDEPPDWLRALDESGAELEAPAEVPPLIEPSPIEDEDLPEWLRDLGEPTVEAEEEPPAVQVPPLDRVPAAPSADEEELPEWLVGPPEEEFEEETIISPIEAAPSPAVPALEEREGEEIPEWLREVGELEVVEEEAPSAWLADLDAVEEKEDEPPEAPTLIMPEAPIEEIEESEELGEVEIEAPQWLQDLQEMAPTLAEEATDKETTPPDWLTQPTAPGVTIEEGEVPEPGWLQELEPSDRQDWGEEREAAPPDWLSELGPPVSLLDEAEEERVVEVPSWLEELELSAEARELEEVPPFIGVEAEELSETIKPPVSGEPAADAEEISAEPIAIAEEESEDLARAEIPDWLIALRPREPGEEPAEAHEIMELSGPLAGIKGVLPVEPIVSLPHLERPETMAVETLSVSGDLFAEIVAQPPSIAVKAERPDTRFVADIQRLLIYLLLLAAVVVPILVGPIYGPLDAAELQTGADRFYALLDGRGGVVLAEDAVVVVAFDYNPAMAAELSLQARAIIDHLMRRGLRIMAISLYPEGAALAWDVLDELAAQRGYTYGENYIHLGFLPNQPVSVRDFMNVGPAGERRLDYRNGQPVSQYAIGRGVEGLSSVALIVELAGDESTLRAWVEQIVARNDVPVVAGVSAATAPYVRPYLDSGQLQALLVGLTGAAEYEAQLGQSGKAIKSLGSQTAAQAVIVLLIFLGNLAHLVTRRGKK